MKNVKPTRITMQDVAREAGVSQSTVSFVLNANTDVRIAEDTQMRVIEAASRLGYRHRAGERLRGRSQGPFVGFMIDEIATSIFASISIEGAREMAWSSNHVLDIAMTGGDRDYEKIVLKRWMDDGVAGIIYASILTRHITPPEILDSANAILLNCHDGNKRFAAVVPSEKLGGYTATEALIEAGYTRIAHIAGEQWMEAAAERLDGYRNALISNGMRVVPELIVAGNFLPFGGYEAAHKLMDLPEPPDAIFCANDLTAVGAYQALAERGKKIPGDVAIIGYDDQEIARHMNPPLSTILLPHREMGEWAVEYLLTRKNPEGQKNRIRQLECPLVRRESF